MHVAHGIDSLRIKSPVVTMGFFDGVHAGHSFILKRTLSISKSLQCPSLVITFWPHPRIVLQIGSPSVSLLSSLDEKIDLIDSHGVDALLVMEFNSQFAAMPASQFVNSILVHAIKARHMVVGHNHFFGHNGEGSFQLLEQMAPTYGFTTEQIAPVQVDGQEVRSSLVRQLLLNGSLSRANRMLSRPYQMEGRVEEGLRLGRTIGFPTANITPSFNHKLIPANGVYAVWVHILGNKYPAMLNIGVRPTVSNENRLTLEAHIIGFNGDAYSQTIKVSFIDRIRDEIKFPSIDALKAQLGTDREDALAILSEHNDSSIHF